MIIDMSNSNHGSCYLLYGNFNSQVYEMYSGVMAKNPN